MFLIDSCLMPSALDVICNIGHFDNEIDVEYLKKFEWFEIKTGVHKVIREDGDYLILLGEGRLVNLL